ncbi:hypothetical protein KCV06_g576, partial [Aureobasidium melanogenum]
LSKHSVRFADLTRRLHLPSFDRQTPRAPRAAESILNFELYVHPLSPTDSDIHLDLRDGDRLDMVSKGLSRRLLRLSNSATIIVQHRPLDITSRAVHAEDNATRRSKFGPNYGQTEELSSLVDCCSSESYLTCPCPSLASEQSRMVCRLLVSIRVRGPDCHRRRDQPCSTQPSRQHAISSM